ncbi:MAG TPA: hypothetical protein VHZ50_12435 [Puia sp.]|jgi:hypothetical protein|nr:hypothetical protein [Puia sp.]
MKLFNLIFFSITVLQCSAQKIIYSDFEKEDFDRFRFDVIAKHNDRILVYKGIYLKADGGTSSPDNSIMENRICFYDLQMKIVQQIILPLPKEISGVHFLTYEDHFFMFYQYQRGHTIHCMTLKIDMDGKIIGAPIEMDKTTIADIHYQSKIYSVINSANKKNIAAFKIDNSDDRSYTITSLFFNDKLELLHRSSDTIFIADEIFFREFNIDDEGDLAFVGIRETSQKNDHAKAIFFSFKRSENKMFHDFLIPTDLFVDNVRLEVDNVNRKYILTSFYSEKPNGNIKGLYSVIKDAATDNNISITKTILSDTLATQLGGDLSNRFNNYYLQNIHLRQNGGFVAEAIELSTGSQNQLFIRWNYFHLIAKSVASNFVFYDQNAFNYYTPWMQGNFSSLNTLVMSFSDRGILEWINVVKTSQEDKFQAALGYASVVANGLIYFVFNEKLKSKIFLVAQSINTTGQLNTDSRLKEDLEIRGQNKDLTHYPRFAKPVSANEIIFPCRKNRGYICLAKIEF